MPALVLFWTIRFIKIASEGVREQHLNSNVVKGTAARDSSDRSESTDDPSMSHPYDSRK